MGKRLSSTFFTVACVAALLSGCGQGVENTVEPAAKPANSVTVSPTASSGPAANSATVSPTASVEPADEESTPSELTKRFGSTFTWDDGVAITVSKPKTFKKSAYAAGGKDFNSAVSMEVTIKNGSAEPIEAFEVFLKATTGDVEAEAIFDEGIDSPSAKILPGKSLKYKTAFGVNKGQDFVLTVSYGFGNSDGIYQD